MPPLFFALRASYKPNATGVVMLLDRLGRGAGDVCQTFGL